MMKFARFIVAFYVLTLVSIAAFAQLTDAQKVDLPEVNLLKNSGFEHGMNGWKKNGGTVAHVTSGENLLFGKGSVTFDASQSGDYIESELVTIPGGLANKDCTAWIYYKGGSANYELRVYDGSNSLVMSRAIEAASATAEKIEVGFTCGVAGSQYKLRVHATGDGDLIVLDRGYLGELSGIHGGNVFIDSKLSVSLTPSNTSNLDTTPSISAARYFRIGNLVELSLRLLNVNPTTANQAFYFYSTIPVPSDFTAPADALGVCVGEENIGTIEVTANTVENKLYIRGTHSDADASNYVCKVTYVVK